MILWFGCEYVLDANQSIRVQIAMRDIFVFCCIVVICYGWYPRPRWSYLWRIQCIKH